MRTFTIDTDDNITVFASCEELGDLKAGTLSFANEEELARLAAGWPGSRLVEIWNAWRAFSLSKSLLAARPPSPGFGRPFRASGRVMSSSRPQLASPRRRRHRQAGADAVLESLRPTRSSRCSRSPQEPA
jgi:hypothetical protein